MWLENCIATCQRVKPDYYLTPYAKNEHNMDYRLEQKPKTIKLLHDNIGSKLLDIDLGDNFLALTLKAKATKAKINKWDYIKLKSFCSAKKTINKIKRQPMNEGKYLKIIYLIRG